MAGMKDATVRQLQIFEASARALSFSAAAQALHLTQPAVSMQIRQLEHFAGVELFERVGRKLQLTEAGEELLVHARAVLRALDDADEVFAAMKGLHGGRVRLAVVSTAKYFAPRLLARFAQAHPGVRVRLQAENRAAVVRALVANEVDLALMGQPPDDGELVARTFAEHPLVVIAPPDHPLARRKSVPLEALAAETFLVREPGSGTRGALERFFAERKLGLVVGLEMPSNETIKQAVMAGLGLGFISMHTIALELSVGALALVNAPGLPVMRQWNVVHRKDKRLAPAAQAFKAFVLEHGQSFLAKWRGV